MKKLLFSLLSFLSGLHLCSHGQDFESDYQRAKAAFQYYVDALEQFDHGEIDLSDSLVSRSIYLNPKYADSYQLRAEIREANGETLAALVDYETVILLDPENAEARFKKASLYYEQKNYEQAIEDIDLALHSDDSHETSAVFYQTNEQGEITGIKTINRLKADMVNLRGLCWMELDDEKRALEDFEDALDLGIDLSIAMNNKGMTHLNKGDTLLAIEAFEEVLKHDSNDQKAIFNLSFLKKITHEQQKQMLVQEPNPNVLSKKAYDKFLDEDYDGALLDYEKAVKIAPEESQLWMHLGITQARLKLHKKAVASYERSLSLNEKQIRNYYLMANSYSASGENKLANQYYQLYLLYDKSLPTVYYNYAISLHKEKKNKEACIQLHVALELGMSQAQDLIDSFCQNP